MSKRLLVTGAHGFLGSELVRELQRSSYSSTYDLESFRSSEFDLLDPSAVRRLLEEKQPEVVVHLAALVGGIGFNQAFPGTIFYTNALMGVQLIEACRNFGVEHFLLAGTVCSYPKFCPVPFSEDDLWNGFPEETNAPYGVAKRALISQLDAYRQQFGFASSTLLFTNLYGGGDNFDLENSHVIPAIIRKLHQAKVNGISQVVLWGDGSASRDFLFVNDAARAILLALDHGPCLQPINVGSGVELPIKQLSAIIAEIVGYQGEIIWDETRPNGQPRRSVDVRRAKEFLGFSVVTPLIDGLRKTYAGFLENHSGELA